MLRFYGGTSFGPHHVRIKFYPESIRKYITKSGVSSSVSYESYNEFENLNRGQYRNLFQECDKSTPLYRYIIQPVIEYWDTQDIASFFDIFGDVNIITSHKKISSVEETKAHIATYFRLSCRLIAGISKRLSELVTTQNIIWQTDNANCHVLFGQRNKVYGDGNRIVRDGDKLPPIIYRHDISEGLKSNPISELLNRSDNSFGYVELDMLNMEETRIKFNMDFCEIISLVAYYMATDKILGILPYGACFWLKGI